MFTIKLADLNRRFRGDFKVNGGCLMGKQFLIRFRLVLAVVICTSSLSIGLGQNRKTSTAKNDDMTVIRGQVAYDEEQMKSWDGNKLVVPYLSLIHI